MLRELHRSQMNLPVVKGNTANCVVCFRSQAYLHGVRPDRYDPGCRRLLRLLRDHG